MRTWLIDTGPLVAYLNVRDPEHAAVGDCLDGFSGRLATTGAVITEAMHFVSTAREGPNLLANFIAASLVEIHESCQPADLRAAVELMNRYDDVPMDFADATLVLLAERLDLEEILTLDRRGFRTFRRSGKRSFSLVLDP